MSIWKLKPIKQTTYQQFRFAMFSYCDWRPNGFFLMTFWQAAMYWSFFRNLSKTLSKKVTQNLGIDFLVHMNLHDPWYMKSYEILYDYFKLIQINIRLIKGKQKKKHVKTRVEGPAAERRCWLHLVCPEVWASWELLKKNVGMVFETKDVQLRKESCLY